MAQPFGAARRFFAVRLLPRLCLSAISAEFAEAILTVLSEGEAACALSLRAATVPCPGRSHEARSHGSISGSRALAPDGPPSPLAFLPLPLFGTLACERLSDAHKLERRCSSARSCALELNGWPGAAGGSTSTTSSRTSPVRR
jgi:hypothetical protein